MPSLERAADQIGTSLLFDFSRYWDVKSWFTLQVE